MRCIELVLGSVQYNWRVLVLLSATGILIRGISHILKRRFWLVGSIEVPLILCYSKRVEINLIRMKAESIIWIINRLPSWPCFCRLLCRTYSLTPRKVNLFTYSTYKCVGGGALAQYEGERSVACLSHLLPCKRTHWVGDWVGPAMSGRFGEDVNLLPLSGIEQIFLGVQRFI